MTFRTMTTAAALGALLLVGCSGEPAGPSAAQAAVADKRVEMERRMAAVYQEEIDAWVSEREERLRRPEGWLSLVGLHWLNPGNSFVGSGAMRGVRLAIGPDELGMITLERDGSVRFRAAREAGVTYDDKPASTGSRELATDADGGTPTVIGFNQGDASFIVIRRGDRVALRVRDALAPSLTGFTGIDRFPADAAYRFVARFEPHPPGQTMSVINMVGQEEAMVNPGAVVFEQDGVSFRLEAVDEGDGRLFLIFSDRTAGHESYPAARFLYANAASANGTTVVDFNKAYNPPCAFTAFSTCPLPPPGNRLDFRVEAGEKKPRPLGAAG